MEQLSDGSYKIHSGTKNVVLNAYAYKPADKTKVNVYKFTDDEYISTQLWKIEPLEDGSYTVRLKYNENLVLAATGKGNGASVVVAKYDAKSELQKWIFIEE